MIRVAIDWGSTSFRAYRFEHTKVIDQIEASCGIKTVLSQHDGNFASVLEQQVGSWLNPGDDVLLSGMITSANGWIETPYIPCPLQCEDICKHLTQHSDSNRTLYFVPGVSQFNPHADVMRGEEVQILGLQTDSSNNASQLVVMPGTHSKWALMQEQQLRHFTTMITGELFSTLVNHTLIGAFANEDDWCDKTFLDAVELGYQDTNIISKLFSARSSVLLNTMQKSEVSAYLSGLLIGSEIREGLAIADQQSPPLTIIGSQALTKKYLTASRHLGITATPATAPADYPDITAAGFAAIISQTGI